MADPASVGVAAFVLWLSRLGRRWLTWRSTTFPVCHTKIRRARWWHPFERELAIHTTGDGRMTIKELRPNDDSR